MLNSSGGQTHAFLTLDALRGIAALAVMQLHMAPYFGVQPFGHAYLAVDFFFMLSGFVLTFAYQERLDQGWSTMAFFKARVIRLYPLYALGLALGFVFAVIEDRFGTVHLPASTLLLFLALGALLLPVPGWYHAGGLASFPLNFPSWSLFFELTANLLHALFMRRRGWKFLLAVILFSGGLWIFSAHRFDRFVFGYYRQYFPYELLGVVCCYTYGCLLFRLWSTGRFTLKLPPFVLALILFGLLATGGTQFHLLIELLIVAVIFPIIILVSASSQPSKITRRFAELLGTASYAIYILHVPISEYFGHLWKRIVGTYMEANAPWSGILYLITVILLALAIDRFYDLPARAFLRSRFADRKAASKTLQPPGRP